MGLMRIDNWIKLCFPKAWERIKDFKCPLCNKEVTLADVHKMKLPALKEYNKSRMCECCFDEIEKYNEEHGIRP